MPEVNEPKFGFTPSRPRQFILARGDRRAADARWRGGASPDRLIDTVTASQQEALETIESASQAMLELIRGAREITDFVAERIRQDLDTQQAFLRCRSLDEVREVQARFVQTALDQYSAETTKLFKLGGDVPRAAWACGRRADAVVQAWLGGGERAARSALTSPAGDSWLSRQRRTLAAEETPCPSGTTPAPRQGPVPASPPMPARAAVGAAAEAAAGRATEALTASLKAAEAAAERAAERVAAQIAANVRAAEEMAEKVAARSRAQAAGDSAAAAATAKLTERLKAARRKPTAPPSRRARAACQREGGRGGRRRLPGQIDARLTATEAALERRPRQRWTS